MGIEPHNEPQDLLPFERLLAEISTSFINLPADRIGDEIVAAQKRICELLDLDRSALLLTAQDDPGILLLTHVYQPPGSPPPPARLNAMDFFPWTVPKLLSGETVAVSKMTELPAGARRDRDSFDLFGTKSAVYVPLSVGKGPVFGVLGFVVTRGERDWPKRVVQQFQLVAQIFANALSRQQAEKSLEERLQFEMLLADISARFVSLPSDQIDGAIADAQRRVCECLGLDLSSLWQWATDGPRSLTMTHIYRALEGSQLPEPIDAQEFFPWCLQQLEANKIIALSSMAELPAEAVRDLENSNYFGIKSCLIYPLAIADRPPMGALCFSTMRAERSWPDAIVKRLQLVSQIFANALARKRAEQELRESETRLSMTTTAAEAGLWIMSSDTSHVWLSPKARELFHFAPDAEPNVESFFEAIHHEDRESVKQALQKAIQSGEYLRSECRVLLPDGDVRWIVALGRSLLKIPGQPERLMGVSIDITERKKMEEKLRQQLKEIEGLKNQFEQENIFLRDEIRLQHRHEEIVGRSAAMKKVLAKVEQVAGTEATVLLQGETGTGKELLARSIHSLSKRGERPLITINCAALPPTLIETELFGREKGAYTGAMTRMAGRFEVADGSTLFLDEIGELSLDLQVKLLRVLEEGRFERLGSTKSLQINVRIIAATNRDLAQEVAARRFRSDLYYRLNVFPILVPPLRERLEDIPSLVWTFVKQYEKKMEKRIDRIPRKSMDALQRYAWPGNVRELKNIVEYAIITSSDESLRLRLPHLPSDETSTKGHLEDVERRHILEVLRQTEWRIAGKGGAAEILGMKRTTLLSKMKKLGIRRPGS